MYCFCLVPTPTVVVTAPSTQIVGQSLTMQCEVTTVRGITSGVEIIWRSGSTELERVNDTTPTTIGNSLVYTDSYTISSLETSDEGRVIMCTGVINGSPSVMGTNFTSLDVTCKDSCTKSVLCNQLGIIVSTKVFNIRDYYKKRSGISCP